MEGTARGSRASGPPGRAGHEIGCGVRNLSRHLAASDSQRLEVAFRSKAANGEDGALAAAFCAIMIAFGTFAGSAKMQQKQAISATVTGNDQHVGFRALVMKQAIEYNLAGSAKNDANDIVTIYPARRPELGSMQRSLPFATERRNRPTLKSARPLRQSTRLWAHLRSLIGHRLAGISQIPIRSSST